MRRRKTLASRAIKEIRSQLGYTQDEFALRIGTSQPVISKAESGLAIPSSDVLINAITYATDKEREVTAVGLRFTRAPRGNPPR